jgi:GTPase SAR1 family protein
MPGITVIDGQSSAGKTTLIERLLESNKSRSIQVSRCVKEPGLKKWRQEFARESGKRNPCHAELKRWLDAGAMLASSLAYDPDRIDLEAMLIQADDGFDEWDEWLVEAENVENPRAKCSVYVLRPLEESSALVEEIERVAYHLPLEDYLRYSTTLPDDAVEPEDEEIVEEVGAEIEFNDELPEKLAEAGIALSESEKERLRSLVQNGVPIKQKLPGLRADCARLLAAEVIIINLHAEQERRRAEATRSQILELYRDWSLRNRISFRSRVSRPGIYLANLLDPRDPQLQKAIAQIKRKLRGR